MTFIQVIENAITGLIYWAIEYGEPADAIDKIQYLVELIENAGELGKLPFDHIADFTDYDRIEKEYKEDQT